MASLLLPEFDPEDHQAIKEVYYYYSSSFITSLWSLKTKTSVLNV